MTDSAAFVLDGAAIADETLVNVAEEARALIALAATSALTEGHGFAGWARVIGVLVAGVLVVRKAPFPLVVIAGAGITALLRLAGVA